MALLNYTTKVKANVTVGEIQAMLAKAGATAIMQEYDDDGDVKSLAFRMVVANGREAAFRLPTDWRPIQIIQQRRRGSDRNYRPWMGEKDHAVNIAWRIVKDWVEAQLALIETEMVKSEQVFLPYMLGAQNRTVYEVFADNPAFLLGPGQDQPPE